MNEPDTGLVLALASRCVSSLIESFVEVDTISGGWSKYYDLNPSEVGIWGTASGIIGVCLGVRLGVDLGRSSDEVTDMLRRACRFLSNHQIAKGVDRGAWSITQLKSPAFVDTTTIALRALEMAGIGEFDTSILDGARWLMSKQLEAGGWSDLEKDRVKRLIPKTCPTSYSLLALLGTVAAPTWSQVESAELRFRIRRGIRALKASLLATGKQEIVSGWGRDLVDQIPEPAYTALAVTALRAAGEDQFLSSHASSIVRLFALSREDSQGPRFDQAPWAIVRDIWTPPAPLAERFMMFFTTAWLVRALAGLGMREADDLVDRAVEWLVVSDRGGKYFDYFKVAHNFAGMDALWACQSVVQTRGTITDDLTGCTDYPAAEINEPTLPGVFISYRRGDGDELAEWLAGVLRAHGYDVWFDSWRTVPGDSVPGVLEDAFRSTRACITMITPTYTVGRWATKEMRTAIELAAGGDYRIIPVVVGNAEIPTLLKEFMSVNFGDGGIDARRRRLPELLRGLEPVD